MKSVLLLCLMAALSLGKKPIELTDANFEHDTQAVTGGTTGDWFILFYDDRFKECKPVKAVWEELSGELFGKVSVAWVNRRENRELRERFNIAHDEVPYVLLMVKGRIYVYDNEDWSIDGLVEFAIEHYPKAERQGKVPVLSGFWDEV